MVISEKLILFPVELVLVEQSVIDSSLKLKHYIKRQTSFYVPKGLVKSNKTVSLQFKVPSQTVHIPQTYRSRRPLRIGYEPRPTFGSTFLNCH
jgi:hypothetical protein